MERVDIVFRAQKLGIDITYDGGRQAVVVEHFEKGGATLDSATLVAVNGDARRRRGAPFAVGDRVRARFRRGRKYFPGVVRAVRGAYDVVYDIAYDDGGEDRDLEADFVKAPKEPAAPPEDARPRLTAALDALRTKLGERAAAVDDAAAVLACARRAWARAALARSGSASRRSRGGVRRRGRRLAPGPALGPPDRVLRRRGGQVDRACAKSATARVEWLGHFGDEAAARAAAAGAAPPPPDDGDDRSPSPCKPRRPAPTTASGDEEASPPPKPEKKPSPPKRKAKDEPETKKPSPPKRKAKRTHRLGSFADERSAAKAYDRACRKHGCPEKCNEVDVCDVCGEPTGRRSAARALPGVVLCDACDCETKLACAGLDAMPEGACVRSAWGGARARCARRDRDREALLANFDGWLERELHPAKVGPYRDAVRRFARGDTFDGRGATIALRSLDQALVDELRLCRDDDAGSAKAHGAPHVPSEALEFLCAFVATASG
ncbi:hypothetical protein SO694_00077171 [Aureococcus anophagefferens]|uniref:AP2/ERF domain-containing protein n=1 Tax=Aureococcus anophagefferens TaxID=44056 RepID=A0ABR1FHU3_AURAN